MPNYVSWYDGKRRQDWMTPPDLYESLHRKFLFTLGGAATPENALCDRFSSEETPVSWIGERVFCNPPWSNIAPFVEKAAEAELAVLLVPARTNAKWFHRAIELGARAKFFKPRPKFVGAPHSSPVDCLYLVFGDI